MANTWSDGDRDRWGRPLVTDPTNPAKRIPYTRCTTVAGALDDTTALKKWAMRGVALGVAQRADLRAEAANARGDNKALDRVAEEALNAAGGKERREIGSLLHGWSEAVDRGEEPWGIDDAGQRDIDAYRQATAHIEWLHIEQAVVHDGWQIAGTPDRIGRLPDGTVVIADVKTGGESLEKFLAFSALKTALQLAIYSRSTGYNVDTGQRFDLGDINPNNGLIIHLVPGSGECRLAWVNLAAGYEAAALAVQVREWRKRRDLWTAA